jgi:hypothetical protein
MENEELKEKWQKYFDNFLNKKDNFSEDKYRNLWMKANEIYEHIYGSDRRTNTSYKSPFFEGSFLANACDDPLWSRLWEISELSEYWRPEHLLVGLTFNLAKSIEKDIHSLRDKICDRKMKQKEYESLNALSKETLFLHFVLKNRHKEKRNAGEER